VRALCPPYKPVLVLGDDDFLSLALLESGYRDVTALDIDADLIRRLDDEAKRRGLSLKARVQDFTAALASDLQKPYHLVVFDPMCTVEGVRFFTDAALHFSERDPGAVLFLHTHLMSLLRPGLVELKAYLEKQGLEPTAFYPAFNVYPVAPGAQKLLGALLRVLNGLFLRSPALRGDEAVVRWFVSDALVLRHKRPG
jgi:predicted methyltransferase